LFRGISQSLPLTALPPLLVDAGAFVNVINPTIFHPIWAVMRILSAPSMIAKKLPVDLLSNVAAPCIS
jgi:hypothetical protein